MIFLRSYSGTWKRPSDTFHAEYSHPYVQFVSGFSAGSFKSLITNIEKTAYEAMVATLNDPAYDVLEFPSRSL